MSIFGLFNRRCSWRRKGYTAFNSFGEPDYTDTVIATNVLCRLEKFEDRQLLEAQMAGDHNIPIYYLYLIPTDIEPNDIVTVEDYSDYLVQDVDDAAGQSHHFEVLLQRADQI